VSDDDGSLGVVDPGLEDLGDNMDWGRCDIDGCWSGNSYWCRSG
jgi:hypothetical protein